MTEGIVSVRWISGAWAIIKEDGTPLPASGSVANILQTAIDYAAAGGWPLRLVSSRGRPFEIDHATITFPTSYGNMVDARACWFVFNNGAEPGLIFDTQAFGKFDLGGGQVRYSGTGPAVMMQPKTSYVLGLGLVVIWSQGHHYDLGTILAVGGTPSDALLIDPTQRVDENPDQRLTSGFVCNYVRFCAEGWGQGQHGLRYLTPVHANQTGGENTFDFRDIEGFTVQQAKIGTTQGSLNDNLGTNIYRGNIAGGPGGGIETFASWDQWHLHSANIYGAPNANADYTVKFRPGARGNVLTTKQIIAGSVGAIHDEGSTPTEPNQINVLTFAPPPPGDFQSTQGPLVGPFFAGTFTYVDRSTRLANGRTVIKRWLYSNFASIFPLKIVRRNAAGSYDVITSVTIAHMGGGWQSIDDSYAIPNDGKEYYPAVFMNGTVQSMINFKDRAYTAADATGNGVAMIEQANDAQGWLVIPLGVTYQ